MAVKTWQTIKVRYCHHADAEVELEAQTVYPAEWLPDQPPRILAHRCSHAFAWESRLPDISAKSSADLLKSSPA